MAEPYNEVDLEVNVALPLSSSMPPPPYEFEPTTNKVKDYSLNPTQTPKTFTSGLRLRNAVKYLALFEIVLGIISVGSAYIDTSYGNGLYAYYGVWFEAPGIWVGILCIITAGFLLWILCNSTSNRCVMMAHFVLLIINTIGSAVLIMFSFEWIFLCRKIMQQRVTDNTLAALLIFNIILFLLSIILCKNNEHNI